MRSRPLIPIAAAATLGLLTLGALPAAAAGNAISPGDSLYTIACDGDYPIFQLFSVESTTAVSTPIGTGAGEPTMACAGQAAYNPATGVSYYIQWQEETALAIIDVATGASTTVDRFYWDNGEFPEYITPDAMAIGGDGAAYVIDAGSLYSLDLETAYVDYIGAPGGLDIYSFAWDSVTDAFYVITTDWDVYEIDVTDGTTTFVGTLGFTGDGLYGVYSLQFDKAGTLWIELDVDYEVWEGGSSTLWSATFATLDAPVLSGYFTDDPFYTQSLLIIPGQPKLAATGADTASALPWALGGVALLALGGLALVATARRRAA